MHLISRRSAALYKQHQIPPRSLAATDELFALTKNLPLYLRQCVSATHSILPCEFQSLFNLAWGILFYGKQQQEERGGLAFVVCH